MTTLRFVDLFAGLGGFHLALRDLGHRCVFASEIDPQLRAVYEANFPKMKGRIFGDIREHRTHVPSHDILCAGFPCQPFSKSGFQEGTNDKTRGTLFHEIIEILRVHRPKWVLLENVGNFERHDKGRTWRIVKESISKLGYDVRGTEHVSSRSRDGATGQGLISPHHLGYPHSRERFFVVATRGRFATNPFPRTDRRRLTTLADVVQQDLTPLDIEETKLTSQQRRCIEHWNAFIKAIPPEIELPWIPIWGDEIGATYPFTSRTPWALRVRDLRRHISHRDKPRGASKAVLLGFLPAYARTPKAKFPHWKIRFIRANREWFRKIAPHMRQDWIRELRAFPPSLRKLEWNVKGGERDLWQYVLQFRPSGVRVRRYDRSPSLVSMTITQVPLLGPEGRFLTRLEGLRLQGFPDGHRLPASRVEAFAALGNAVHVEVAKAIARQMFASLAHPISALVRQSGSKIRVRTTG